MVLYSPETLSDRGIRNPRQPQARSPVTCILISIRAAKPWRCTSKARNETIAASRDPPVSRSSTRQAPEGLVRRSEKRGRGTWSRESHHPLHVSESGPEALLGTWQRGETTKILSAGAEITIRARNDPPARRWSRGGRGVRDWGDEQSLRRSPDNLRDMSSTCYALLAMSLPC
jgi:hypothetical protein